MNEPARKLSATYPEYLAQEQASETKHEFLNGEMGASSRSTKCIQTRSGPLADRA
jgi:hypothetical protein